jgi:hypothetical protein
VPEEPEPEEPEPEKPEPEKPEPEKPEPEKPEPEAPKPEEPKPEEPAPPTPDKSLGEKLSDLYQEAKKVNDGVTPIYYRQALDTACLLGVGGTSGTECQATLNLVGRDPRCETTTSREFQELVLSSYTNSINNVPRTSDDLETKVINIRDQEEEPTAPLALLVILGQVNNSTVIGKEHVKGFGVNGDVGILNLDKFCILTISSCKFTSASW